MTTSGARRVKSVRTTSGITTSLARRFTVSEPKLRAKERTMNMTSQIVRVRASMTGQDKMKTLLCATGVTLLFAGLLAFFYGYGTQFQYPYIRIGASAVRTQYICIAGAVVAVVGAGVTVMGLMRSKG